MRAKDFINMWAEQTRKIYGESYDPVEASYATCKEEEEKKEQETAEPEAPIETKPDETPADIETEPEQKNEGCCDEDVESATAEVEVKEDKKEEDTQCDGQIDEGLMDFLKHPIQTIKDQYAKYIDNKQWEEITKKAKEVGAQGVKAASQKIVTMLKSNEHAKLTVKSGTTKQPIGSMCLMEFKGITFLCITQKGNVAEPATLDTLEQVLKGGVSGDGSKPIKKFTQGIGAILFLSKQDQKDGNTTEGKLITNVEESNDGITFVPDSISMNRQKDDISKAELFS